MKRPGWALVVLGLLGAQAGAYAAYRAVEERRERSGDDPPFVVTPTSGTAPDVTFARRDGEPVKLSALKGRVVVLHFWATWCEPCARELPSLLEFTEATGSKNVAVLAVSLDDSWKHVETFLDGPVPDAVVRGVAGDEAARYSVGPLPQTFLISPHGQLVSVARGARDWTSSKAYEAVEAAR